MTHLIEIQPGEWIDADRVVLVKVKEPVWPDKPRIVILSEPDLRSEIHCKTGDEARVTARVIVDLVNKSQP